MGFHKELDECSYYSDSIRQVIQHQNKALERTTALESNLNHLRNAVDATQRGNDLSITIVVNTRQQRDNMTVEKPYQVRLQHLNPDMRSAIIDVMLKEREAALTELKQMTGKADGEVLSGEPQTNSEVLSKSQVDALLDAARKAGEAARAEKLKGKGVEGLCLTCRGASTCPVRQPYYLKDQTLCYQPPHETWTDPADPKV